MDAVTDIKSRLDVVDIVSEYAVLKPAGSGSFKTNCPFHQEKTPSFYVNRPRQSWHCFGCDLGGDLIAFVQKIEGLDFPETLAILAQKAGIELPQFDPQLSSDKKRMYDINELASKFYRSYLLQSPEAEIARAYATKRNIDDLTGDLWGIGYAPESWDALGTALKQKDITENELIQAGLCQKREKGNGIYDRFRGRLMFTIRDVHGNIIGFTGRILTETKEQPKYVNTPETLVYKKSHVLYGLDKAKGEIKKQNKAVIVEGNMDVLSSHRSNINLVVAASGTALTAEQLQLLKRFTKNLYIAFDADNAGSAATLRGLDLARQQEFDVRIITIPSEQGKDADDLVRKDPKLWTDAIAKAIPIMDWVYRHIFRDKDTTRPENKKQIVTELAPELLRIPNPVERDAWIKRVTNDLEISEESIREALRIQTVTQKNNNFKTNIEKNNKIDTRETVTTTTVAKVRTREDELTDQLDALIYLQPSFQTLAENVLGAYDAPRSSDHDRLNYLAAFADREFQDQSVTILRREFDLTSDALRKLRVNKHRMELEVQMRDAEIAGDENRIRELLTQFNNLN
ncbi:DNA primase [Candidatus Uhrbacteria bacterium]|nr:DNA primase [Candidatus Uhrbacteria bacterium]